MICSTPVLAKFYRYTDEEVADAVFAFEKDGAGKDLLFILQDRFAHSTAPSDGA
jgi:hypothetical protein